MSELHALGVRARTSAAIEGVGANFLREGVLDAQRKSWEALRAIQSRLRTGMTEKEGVDLAVQTCLELGSKKYWHKPTVRFGPGTLLTFYDGVQPDYTLQEGDPVFLDIGPVWEDEIHGLEYEGDVGDTFAHGSNTDVEECVKCLHQMWKEARDLWKKEQTNGVQLYAFLKRRAGEIGYTLVERVTGHRLSDYPHVKYSKERLSNIAFCPSESLWILEFQIAHPNLKLGAFYEDLLQ